MQLHSAGPNNLKLPAANRLTAGAQVMGRAGSGAGEQALTGAFGAPLNDLLPLLEDGDGGRGAAGDLPRRDGGEDESRLTASGTGATGGGGGAGCVR